MTTTERTILINLRSGDLKSFDTIYHRFNKKLYSFSFSFLKDHEQADEMVQDVFVSLWEKREQINPELPFENYLITICYNSIRKFFRRRKIENKVMDYLSKNVPESITETGNTVIYNELMELVERTVNNMPPKQKTVYKLSRQEGIEIKEIAERLNISSRTVETHLTNALKIIRMELGKISL